RVQCQGARSPNECGGCATLAAAVGSACEGCGTAVWGCESSEAVACLASSPPNACGGCAALEGNPGDPCGACPGGALGCALDGESVFCEAEQALNACGGCAALPAGEGDPCGPCGLDTFVCAGPDALSCSGSTQCLDGAACTVDAECVDRRCSFGRCAPLGWAFVPAATFVMGAPLGEPGFHPARENGQHTVILTHPILVKETTVTQGEWFELLGTRPSYFDACGDECPVERVNWYEMLQYADALSIRDGLTPCYGLTGCVGALGQGCGVGVDRCGGYSCDPPIDVDLGCPGYRLPTEAEWEYFARAGTTSAFITASGTLGSWPALPPDPELDAIAWFGGNSQVSYAGAMDCSWIDPSLPSCGTNPVGMKAPNAWGLFDITGNVWERVWDWSGDYPAPGTTVTDPLGPMFGTERRMRGGPFDAWGQYMRVAYRTGPVPTARFYNIGFRLVRSLSLP
ncbi:MAG: formylglycine-generating enzyme family protein, partial [Myxococcales bacterium]|nr:formylglycine-generating enzyme family protein [Myxococcales bacterium]